MSKDKEAEDFIHIGPQLPSGAYAGIRETNGEIVPAVVLPAGDGRPLPPGAEFVTTERCSDERGKFRITASYKHKGPAQVSNPNYRKNYDAIFGKKPRTSDLN